MEFEQTLPWSNKFVEQTQILLNKTQKTRKSRKCSTKFVEQTQILSIFVEQFRADGQILLNKNDKNTNLLETVQQKVQNTKFVFFVHWILSTNVQQTTKHKIYPRILKSVQQILLNKINWTTE